jgi:hypothetical protein
MTRSCPACARVRACDPDWRPIVTLALRAAAAFSAAAAFADAVRSEEDGELRGAGVRFATRWEAGPSLVPITAMAANVTTPAVSNVGRQESRRRARKARRLGRRIARVGPRPATGGTRPTGGATGSREGVDGAWTASWRAAESSLQNASAAGGIPWSRSCCVARALAARPIGTSSSGGPSQSRGSRMTFSSFGGSPPLSSLYPSPVSTGFADLSSVRVPVRLRGAVQYNPELAPVCLN